MSECRHNIVTTYAGWTALSAFRSGAPFKSRQRIYPLLRSVDFAALFFPNDLPITPADFANWHRSETDGLCKREPELCTGWATKLLNVYLKTTAYVGGLGRPGLSSVIHPPIDGGLWSGLERRFRDHPKILAKTHVVRRIKDIRNYETYETIIAGCRDASAVLGCFLIEVEQFWEGADVDTD